MKKEAIKTKVKKAKSNNVQSEAPKKKRGRPFKDQSPKDKHILDPVMRPWGLNNYLKNRVILVATAMMSGLDRTSARTTQESYYLVDYCDEKLLFSREDSILLCGYSRATATKDGLLFYNRIMEREDWEWLFQMNAAAYKVFYDAPFKRRLDFAIHYHLRLVHRNGHHFTVKHELTPLNICKRGNMWIALCKVSLTKEKYCPEAYIIDNVKGKRYDFINGVFELNDESATLSDNERVVLRLASLEVPAEEIATMLGTTINTINLRRNACYKKLGVSSLAGAIVRAKELGVL